MTPTCPDRHDLLRLLDGELTENRAEDVRAHLVGCRACADALAHQRALIDRIAAPIHGIPSPEAVAGVMARLDAAVFPARDPGSRRRWSLAAASFAAAAAVLALVLVRAPTAPREPGVFQPRGAGVEWSRKVGIELWALGDSIARVTSGARVPARTALVGSYSNADGAPAYLLAFALDPSGELHWLYPAFLDPASDPESIRLDPSTMQRAFPDSVILDDLGPGAVRFVFVVTREPLHVSDLESAPRSARTPEALATRWPDARIDDLPALLVPTLPPQPRGTHP